MWSRKHSESRIDGGGGIGAISVTCSSGTVDADRSASFASSCSAVAPRPIRSSRLTPGVTGWIVAPSSESTPVRWPLSARKFSHRIVIQCAICVGDMRANERANNVTVDEFEVADPSDAWVQAGFSVDSDAACRVGGVQIRLSGRGRGTGIVGWSLHGLPSDGSLHDVDGIPTTRSDGVAVVPARHANGVLAIDHVVLLSPDLRRTVDSLAVIGIDPRRERDGQLGGRSMRQIFFRPGDVIIEVVGSPETVSEGPSTLWGITYVVAA